MKRYVAIAFILGSFFGGCYAGMMNAAVNGLAAAYPEVCGK